MLKVSEDGIRKFQEIYQADYGIALSHEEARKEAQEFLDFAYTVLKP